MTATTRLARRLPCSSLWSSAAEVLGRGSRHGLYIHRLRPTTTTTTTRLGNGRREFSMTAARRVAGSLMDTSCLSATQLEVREAVGRVCSQFSEDYWAACDAKAQYPGELHAALARDGWIGIALPAELGGAGLGIAEATAMMHAVAETNGAGMQGAQSLHANVYATQPVARFATPEQRAAMLPPLIRGDARACFAVTEPDAGLDTLSLRTAAVLSDDGSSYSVTGKKIWITSAQVATKMMLLARTDTNKVETVEANDGGDRRGARRSAAGLSLFFFDLDRGAPGIELRPIRKMGGRGVDANEIFFDGYQIPADTLIGGEGNGFRVVLNGMNAERCLLAGEALGLGYAALRRAAAYARDRVVFGRAIGANQGIAHPLAAAFMQLEAAKLATYHAANLFDRARAQESRGEDAAGRATEGQEPVSSTAVGLACNSAKYLAAEAAAAACERAVLSMGGMGYAADFHVERYLRECFVPRIAPVSGEMIKNFVAEKALGLPRSY